MEVKRRVLEQIGGKGVGAGAGYTEVADTLLSLKIEFCEQHLALAQVSSIEFSNFNIETAHQDI